MSGPGGADEPGGGRPGDALPGDGAHRAALFDLAIERALTYLTRARIARTPSHEALTHSLEVWYLKTRFAARIPLDDIVAALARRPEGSPREWIWQGGRLGGWRRRDDD